MTVLIIKHGKLASTTNGTLAATYQKTCATCECTFEYTANDTVLFNYPRAVKCPECNEWHYHLDS